MQINTAIVTLFACPGLQTNPVTMQGLVVTRAVVSCSSHSPLVTFGHTMREWEGCVKTHLLEMLALCTETLVKCIVFKTLSSLFKTVLGKGHTCICVCM